MTSKLYEMLNLQKIREDKITDDELKQMYERRFGRQDVQHNRFKVFGKPDERQE
jgi:hypothetical protein